MKKISREDAKLHLHNLVNMAMKDGHLDELEIAFLMAMAKRFGYMRREMQEMISKRLDFSDEIQRPEKEEYIKPHLFDIVCMMMIDGDIDDDELEMCYKIAELFGQTNELVDTMIEEVKTHTSMGHKPHEIHARTEYMLNHR
jgi:DnaJ-domain-containing protein 1